MNFRASLDEGDGQFQLAPMIDVVFIMLTFFVAIFGMQQSERELEVKPPLSYSGDAINRKLHDIVINIRQDGTIIVNRKQWDINELRRQLKLFAAASTGESSVLIRADGEALHQNVVAVMDACIEANMYRFSFITVEKSVKAAN